MALDQTPIGKLSAELMDELESNFSEQAKIGAVVLIVEVTDQNQSQVVTKVNDPRSHVTLGLMEIARHGLLETR
jgi:hypothetical protein